MKKCCLLYYFAVLISTRQLKIAAVQGAPTFIVAGTVTLWFGSTCISDFDPDYMPLGTTKLRFTLDRGKEGVPARTGTICGNGVSSHLNVNVSYNLIGSFDLESRLVCICLQAHPLSGPIMHRVRRYIGFMDTSGTSIKGDYAHGSFELVKKDREIN